MSAVVAACSVALTLAVSTDGRSGEPAAVNGAQPLTAQPDAATLYHHRSMAERRR